MTAVDIREFIEARLTEDQALIERNTDGNGLDDGFPDYRTYNDSDTRAADDYINRFGPARVLREIEAKRAILALHMGGYVELEDGTRIPFCEDRSADPDFNGDLWAPCLTARLLAAPYADHEDYVPKWSVTE